MDAFLILEDGQVFKGKVSAPGKKLSAKLYSIHR